MVTHFLAFFLISEGFLSGLTRLLITTTGNYSHTGSRPTCHCCHSPRQETLCIQFPVRLTTAAIHRDRKLFAKGFPSGSAPLCFTPTGNFLRIVSYPACHRCRSPRQETFCVVSCPACHCCGMAPLPAPPIPHSSFSSGPHRAHSICPFWQ